MSITAFWPVRACSSPQEALPHRGAVQAKPYTFGAAGMDEELLSGVGTVLTALFKGYNDHFHQFVALLPSQVRL